MGWSYDSHTEFFILPSLVEKFSLEKLNPSPAAINFSKLDHFNGLHIRALVQDDLAARVRPFFARAGYSVDDAVLRKITPLIQERLVTLDDCLDFGGFFFEQTVEPKAEELIAKGLDAKQSAEVARKAYEILSGLPQIVHETAEPPLRELVEKLALKPNQVFGILRVALTGQTVSPPLFESMEVIGREKVLERVRKAIEILEKMG